MSSIATAVFKATVGLLINKARDKAAKKLKEGDVTDEKFRSLIVREIDQINSKLDGLARKDLLSSISALKEGVAILFDIFKQASRGVNLSRENVTGQEEAVSTADALEVIKAVSLQSASGHAEAVSLAKKLANLQMIDLDESSKKLLSDSKKRFEEARSKARDAFSNEGLDTADRILAMMVRVMATILDNIDNPRNALTPCRVCLEELHAMPAVKKNFNIALEKGLQSWFWKDERKEIIASVYDINHAIFDVTLMVGSNGLVWPLINVGEENIHPLRDTRRVAEVNHQNAQYIGFYPIQWSFGIGKLKSATCVCTNTKDQFIVGDYLDDNIKVFDSDGNFLHIFSHTLENKSSAFICDIAIDQGDNVYVLCGENDRVTYQVRIFDNGNNMHHCFVVDGLRASHLTVAEKSSKQVLVLGTRERSNLNFVVNVYDIDGTFIRNLLGTQCLFVGEAYQVRSITACSDGRVMVLHQSRVYVFSAKEADCLHQFSVGQKRNRLKEVAAETIHWADEHVTVVSKCTHPFEFDVSIYTEHGELLEHFPITSSYPHQRISGITMNRQGRIMLALTSISEEKGEILVF